MVEREAEADDESNHAVAGVESVNAVWSGFWEERTRHEVWERVGRRRVTERTRWR